MTAEQLRAAALELVGEEMGWQSRLADALKTSAPSVSRWLGGTIEVPGPVEIAVRCLLILKRKRIRLPA